MNKKGGFEWSLENTGKAILAAVFIITALIIIALVLGPVFFKFLSRFDFW